MSKKRVGLNPKFTVSLKGRIQSDTCENQYFLKVQRKIWRLISAKKEEKTNSEQKCLEKK